MCQLRNEKFTSQEANVNHGNTKLDRCPFERLVAASQEFAFDNTDIVRLREEIRTLIERLSMIYLFFKKEEKQQKQGLGK